MSTTRYNFNLASDIPRDDYSNTDTQYAIGGGQNDVCGQSSTLYANTFQPSMINKSSEYKCAAYQSDYIGANVTSIESTCNACGGCPVAVDLSAWGYTSPPTLYACSKPGQAPQLANPMFSVSGAPSSALTARDLAGLRIAANDQALADAAVTQETMAAQIIQQARNEMKAQTLAMAKPRQAPNAMVFVASQPLEGFAGGGPFGGSGLGSYN